MSAAATRQSQAQALRRPLTSRQREARADRSRVDTRPWSHSPAQDATWRTAR